MKTNAQQKAEKEKKEFLDTGREWRRIFCEIWGTFLLVLVGAGAAVVSRQTGEISKAMEVSAPGLMVMAIIYFMGSVSGAHLNPAVTVAFALRHHFPWKRVPLYIIAQFAGGILAVLLIKGFIGADNNLGATTPHNISDTCAFFLELLITTGLINTILGTSSGPRNVGHNAAIAIGGYIALTGLWEAPLTGASMNMVRSLAPDIIRGNMSTSWIYLCGSLSGAIVAVAFEWILKGKPSKHATLEAQGLTDEDEEN